MEIATSEFLRMGFGFANPNHAAAAICALFPLCWDWLRYRLFARCAVVLLCVMLALTFSRTGFVVLAFEMIASWFMIWRKCHNDKLQESSHLRHNSVRIWVVIVIMTSIVLLWMAPRLVLDGSILNRPKIWLAGLQLFAANPSGVGLGNSGIVASTFLLRDIPEIRTMVNSHITLLAEFGWLVGWVWFSFIGMALFGGVFSPRICIAFAGFVLSACSSTVFDWPVLFDFSEQGGLGIMNWVLSWVMFAMFVGFGVWLVMKTVTKGKGSAGLWGKGMAIMLAGVVVKCLSIVPVGDAPQVRDGYAVLGSPPRDLVLYDRKATLRQILSELKRDIVIPVHGLTRFPRNFDMSTIGRVILHGDCREWYYLVVDRLVVCVED